MMIFRQSGKTSRFYIRQLAALRHASTARPLAPLVEKQLLDLSRMMSRVGEVNSPADKVKIAAEYPHLRKVLEIISLPNTRFGVTSEAARKLLEKNPDLPSESYDHLYSNLEEFLEALANADGKTSKWLAASFFARLEQGELPAIEQAAAKDALERLLDRNLKIGLGSKVLAQVNWGDKTAHQRVSATQSTATSRVPLGTGIGSFSCALGKSIEPPFKELNKANYAWYASRKLDGVRVVTLVDFLVPMNPEDGPSIANITCVSRTGNDFRSLDRLKEHLKYLAGYPKLRELLDADPAILKETDQGVVKRLVLDGEICVMVPAVHKSNDVRVTDDGTGASSLWKDDGLVEDFSQAVSLVRRHETMQNPVYFVFDMMSWEETATGQPSAAPGLGKTFGQRVPETKELVEWLRDRIKETTKTEPRVRVLTQTLVEKDEVEKMVERSLEEGWEGLIFRADTPYLGKRTGDIRKFKEFQDAEYTVIDLEVSLQRLPVDGVYGMYEACSRVVIEHKGTLVGVGSGFTPVERIAFANDPSAIIGKQITVQYFGESESNARGSGKSLRFPRVKKIWDGNRDV